MVNFGIVLTSTSGGLLIDENCDRQSGFNRQRQFRPANRRRLVFHFQRERPPMFLIYQRHLSRHEQRPSLGCRGISGQRGVLITLGVEDPQQQRGIHFRCCLWWFVHN